MRDDLEVAEVLLEEQTISLPPEEEVTAAPKGPLIGLYNPQNLAPTFSGDATRALALARPIGVIDDIANTLSINNVSISVKSIENLKRIGGGEFKLLNLGVGAFTAINPQNSPSPKLRIYADTKEYARACIKDPSKGIDPRKMPTQEEQEQEDKRAAKALENFLVKLGKNAENLKVNTSLSWSERIQGRKSHFSGLSFIAAYDIDPDVIMLEFTQSAAEYLVKLPIAIFPRSFFAIDDRSPNALSIAVQLYRRYSIDRNVLRDTEQILKVDTLLGYTSLPKYDPNDRYRSRWDSRIKEPFENALEELVRAGFLSKWYYCKSGKIPLTDEEARNIIRYEQFSSLYIYFEIADFGAHDERYKLVVDRKERGIEAAKKRRKRNKTKDGDRVSE